MQGERNRLVTEALLHHISTWGKLVTWQASLLLADRRCTGRGGGRLVRVGAAARFVDQSEFPQKPWQQTEPQGVRSIRQRLFRLVVHLDEDSRHPHSHRGRSQGLDELRLAAGRAAFAAGQLHAVRGVENHRPAGIRA